MACSLFRFCSFWWVLCLLALFGTLLSWYHFVILRMGIAFFYILWYAIVVSFFFLQASASFSFVCLYSCSKKKHHLSWMLVIFLCNPLHTHIWYFMLLLQVQLPSEKAFVRIYVDLSSVSTSIFMPLKYDFFYFQNFFTMFLVYLTTIKTACEN